MFSSGVHFVGFLLSSRSQLELERYEVGERISISYFITLSFSGKLRGHGDEVERIQGYPDEDFVCFSDLGEPEVGLEKRGRTEQERKINGVSEERKNLSMLNQDAFERNKNSFIYMHRHN